MLAHDEKYWDAIIASQERHNGPVVTRLIADVAEAIEVYGDDEFDLPVSVTAYPRA